jgi:cytosine/adenosine deaminase-related metal-dependent hydrolase
MILRARTVVTMDGPPIENGAVAIDANRIVDVGTFDEVRMRQAGEIVDLGEQALLPGLINAHCHLDYTSLRGKIPKPKSFTDWIRAINREKAKLSPADYVASINQGFAEAKRFGTTTIANLTAFPELIPQVQPAIRAIWFAELIDVRASVDVDLAEVQGLAPHAPFTASADLYRRCEARGGLLTTHLAESREEMAMFRDADGPLYDFMKEIGRDMSDCGRGTPIEQFLGHPRRKDWMLVHLNEITESDFDLLARSTSKFSIVHCPRSHKYFEHSPFQFGKLRDLGFNICLGTDSLASNDDLNLFAEMRAFKRSFADVSPEGILQMVTSNPARALGQAELLGRIRQNHHVDLVAVPQSGGDVFEEIIAFEGAPWVMADGKTGED